jgi:hypothetical protein
MPLTFATFGDAVCAIAAAIVRNTAAQLAFIAALACCAYPMSRHINEFLLLRVTLARVFGFLLLVFLVANMLFAFGGDGGGN